MSQCSRGRSRAPAPSAPTLCAVDVTVVARVRSRVSGVAATVEARGLCAASSGERGFRAARLHAGAHA
jgi:hypothetical protein